MAGETDLQVHCCIADCESSQNSTPNLSFHRIPTENFGLRQGWVDIIRASRSEPEWFPHEDAVVCSLHFLPNELIEIPGMPTKLDYDSGKNIVPSLHLGSTISNSSSSSNSKNNSTSGFTTHEIQSTWGTSLNDSSSTKDFGTGGSGSSNAFVPVRIKQEPVDDGYGSYYNDGQQPGSSSKLGKRTKPTWSLKELSDDEGERRPRKPRNRNAKGADSDSSEYEPSSSEEAELSESGSEVDEAGNIISKRKKRRTSFTSSTKSSKTYSYDHQRLKMDSVHQSKNVRIIPQGTTLSSVSPNIMKGKGPSFLNFKLKGNNHINIINSNNNNIIFNQMQQKSKVANSNNNNNNNSNKIPVTTPKRQYGTVNPQIISHLESTRREAPGLKPLNKISTTPELFLMEKVDQIKTLNHITKSDAENYSKCLVIFDQIFKRLSSHPPSDVKKLVTIQLSHLLEIVKQRRDNGNSRANIEKLLTTTNRIHTYLRAWPTPTLLNASPTPTVINSTQAKLLLSNPAIAKQQIPPKSDLPSLKKVPDGLNINIVQNNNVINSNSNNNNIVNFKSNGGHIVSIQQQQQQQIVKTSSAQIISATKRLSTSSKDRVSSPDVISIDDDDDNSNSGFSPVIESVSTVVKKIIPPLPKLNSITKSNQLTIIPTPTPQQPQKQKQQHSRPLIFNEVIPDPCFATNPHPPKEVPKELGDQIPWMGFTDTDIDFLTEEPIQLDPETCKAAAPLFPLGKYPPNVVIVIEKQSETNVKNGSGNGLNTVKVPTTVSNRNKLTSTTAIININTKLPINMTNRSGVPQNIIRTSSQMNNAKISNLLKAYATKNNNVQTLKTPALIQNNANQQLLSQRINRRNDLLKSQSKSNNNSKSNSDEVICISDSDEEEEEDNSSSSNPLQHVELDQVEEQQQSLQPEVYNFYAQNSINMINDTIISNSDYLETETTVDGVEDVQPFYEEGGEAFQQEYEEQQQNDDNNEEECLLGI